MLELGFREYRFVPCVFSMWAPPDARGRSSLMALVSLHVDDGLAAGTDAANAVWQKLQGQLRLSAWNAVSSEGTKFLGRSMKQEDDVTVTIDMDAYLHDVKCIPMPKNRDDACQLSPEEATVPRKLNSCLGYAAKNWRHDIAFGTLWCQQNFKDATVATIREANSVLRSARESLCWRIGGSAVDSRAPSS